MYLSGSTMQVNYYLYYDGLGSVANVTDAGGNVVCSYTYDAFGAIQRQRIGDELLWIRWRATRQ